MYGLSVASKLKIWIKNNKPGTKNTSKVFVLNSSNFFIQKHYIIVSNSTKNQY